MTEVGNKIYKACDFKISKLVLSQERAQWGNKIEFILTVIGFAVGNLFFFKYFPVEVASLF